MSIYHGNSIADARSAGTIISINYRNYYNLRLSIFMNSILKHFAFFQRAPPFPLQGFHGNCFADNVEVIRDSNDVKGLKLYLVAEGKDYNAWTCCCFSVSGYIHSLNID